MDELIAKIKELTAYDPCIDPYSNACSPCAYMEEFSDGDYFSRWELEALLKEYSDGRV